ncbi:MAG TPA: FAD-dependent monooxygenase [Blastocatellia bacterium]|nr:FAD-dependent monooxygenase [Blastocatellia bacterium]
MKITIIGGGPAGLYFAILMKKRDPAREIRIVERDGPNDTFGWGIVFSDQTFSYLKENDEESFTQIIDNCEIWDNVDVVHKDQKITIRGNKFSGIARITFLNLLQRRCLDLGVDIKFRTTVNDLSELDPSDLLVGADGANSLVRRTYADRFQPQLDTRHNKYIWLGTHQLFHGLTLTFRENREGVFVAHSYKFNKSTSTFIVETDEQTWRRAGLDQMSDDETCRYLAEVFQPDLEGHRLLSNNYVKWLNFLLVKNRRWHHQNVVLLGDALHTAHFSIGSGTKLALEDAIALAACFETGDGVERALQEFERARKPVVDRIQEAAESSLLLFENAKDEMDQAPMALAYKLMTRSKRIDYEKLRTRDPQFIAAYDEWRSSSS